MPLSCGDRKLAYFGYMLEFKCRDCFMILVTLNILGREVKEKGCLIAVSYTVSIHQPNRIQFLETVSSKELNVSLIFKKQICFVLTTDWKFSGQWLKGPCRRYRLPMMDLFCMFFQ